MARAGEDIHGRDGFRLHLIRTGAETNGELLEMEASYGGTGAMPPEHFHPHQEERFEVVEGTIRAVIDGTERTYGPGEKFEVAPGVRHRMTADDPARVHWEVRPAMRTVEFFEGLYGEHDADSMMALLREFRDEVRITGVEV